MTFRLLVTGSRRWTDYHAVTDAITAVVVEHGTDLVVVHGACPTDADAIADEFAYEIGLLREPHRATWDNCVDTCSTRPEHRRMKPPGDIVHPGSLPDYCPGAGPRRNRTMVAAGADFALVFLQSHSWGTANCFRYIRDARIPYRRWSA